MNARPKFQVFQGTLWYFCSKKLDVKKFKPCVFITIRSHYYCKYVLIKNNTLSELNIVLRSQLTIMLATPLHLNRAFGPRTAITPIDPSSVYDYDLRASSLAGATSRLSATRCYADAPAFKWRSQRCVIISPSREPIIAHVLLFFFCFRLKKQRRRVYVCVREMGAEWIGLFNLWRARESIFWRVTGRPTAVSLYA